MVDVTGPASLLELINQSFDVMQSSLAQYKIAGYPPNVLVNIPKRACRFYEFYKAPELIAPGASSPMTRWCVTKRSSERSLTLRADRLARLARKLCRLMGRHLRHLLDQPVAEQTVGDRE